MLKNIKNLIKQKESENLEFKSSLSESKETIQTISAFANKKGGKIIIGVSPSGEILGLQIGKKTIEDLANKIKDNTDPKQFPEVGIEKINSKNIIVIKVEEGESKPVFASGGAYKRVGKTTQRISSEEIRKMARETEKVYWDEQVYKGAKLTDIDWKFVEEIFIPLYEETSGKKIAGGSRQVLVSLRCIQDKKITNAGILLFGKDPQKFFTNAYIALARYKGEDVDAKRLDYKEFTGNLFRQIDGCNNYIIEHIAVMSRLQPGEVRREDIPEYGKFSIRELITNAICHRDYSDQGSKIIIKMFDNKIEFYNRGGLPEGITPENIVKEQYSRNPTVAKVLSKVEYIEELGEGWDKIIKEHKLHPLRPKMPEIKADQHSVLVALFSTKGKFEEERIEIELNERQRKGLEYLKKHKKITNKIYRNMFPGMSDRTVLNDLTDLVNKNILKKAGKTKGVYYMLSNSEIIPK